MLIKAPALLFAIREDGFRSSLVGVCSSLIARGVSRFQVEGRNQRSGYTLFLRTTFVKREEFSPGLLGSGGDIANMPFRPFAQFLGS